MKRKTLITDLILFFFILFFFVPLISVMPTVKADEMFFVDFYAVDSQGTPLSGVKIEVTGIYGYDEFAYTESNGYAPSLELISDSRNAHYIWIATYQLYTESGDFYVPDNYNEVNIVMSDVTVPTPTPTLTPTPTATPTPSIQPSPSASPTPTQTPTSSPSPSPTPEPTPEAQFNLPIEYVVGGIAALLAIVVVVFFLRKN